jgi:diacylglycerol O-acyltransferase
MPMNVTISNVPGPPMPLYCAGAKVTALHPVSIPAHGAALNITVQSYMNALNFGLTADRRAVPDVALLGDYLVTAAEELKKAVIVS